MWSMSNIKVKFLIDKKQNRVLFAEAGSDFIDVLFSFLTLPLGSIVWRLGKQSWDSGSIDNLYKSVQQLEDDHFQSKDCKEMLLNPRSAAVEICENLKIKNIHDGNPMVEYICCDRHRSVQSRYYYANGNGRCARCGKRMSEQEILKKETANNAGVFVENRAKFMITDDLRLMPISLMSGVSLVEEQRTKDTKDLEERIIDICTEKALSLLRSFLVSKYALTKFCFPNGCIEEQSAKSFSTIKKEIDNSEAEQKINIKIILNKKNNKVLYAEVGGDFVDQLLSFLTFPLGFVVRLIGDDRPMKGCINNLYSSAESLDIKSFKLEKCKNMVVSPELDSCYKCKKQLLKLDEMTCQWNQENCGGDFEKGYVENSRRFLVSDNLQISPFSVISVIKGVDFPVSDISEKEVSVGKTEVISLLSAMLISKTVLTDVFSPIVTAEPNRQRSSHYM